MNNSFKSGSLIERFIEANKRRYGSRQNGSRQRSLKKGCRLGRATELVFLCAATLIIVNPKVAIAGIFAWDGVSSNTKDGTIQGGSGTWNATNQNSTTQFDNVPGFV